MELSHDICLINLLYCINFKLKNKILSDNSQDYTTFRLQTKIYQWVIFYCKSFANTHIVSIF